MRVKLFADTASLPEMIDLYEGGLVRGFTTNPTLMRRAGVTDYPSWACQVLDAIPDLPVSFEVLSDDPPTMIREGLTIGKWGRHVYVKVPIMTTDGESTHEVIATLLDEGVKVNVTGICDPDLVDDDLLDLFGWERPDVIVSVFAGRIADTGVDPVPEMSNIAEWVHTKWNTEVLWASTRQVYSIKEAESAGVDIITLTPDQLRKVSWFDRDLTDLTQETVKQFVTDSQTAGYTL